MSVCTHPADPEIADNPFCKALRWRGFDSNEALGIAAIHRHFAAEARLRHPGREAQAARHDQMAAICENHAVTLREQGDAYQLAKAPQPALPAPVTLQPVEVS